MSQKTVSIIGGDLRQLTVARLLQDEGFLVKLYGWNEEMSSNFEAARSLDLAVKSDILLFPMPICIGNTINAPFSDIDLEASDILNNISKKSIVLGGKIPKNVIESLNRRDILYADYLKREELAIKNALITAEGALEIAMRETPITIHNSKCVVTGYGRIAKILARSLRSLGAKTVVAARRVEVRAEVENDGLTAVDICSLKDECESADIVFNTVPALLFDREILSSMNKKAILIDLASKPGGVDFENAKKTNVNVIWALSLPGKVAPVTSGKIIFETILNILKEMEVIE